VAFVLIDQFEPGRADFIGDAIRAGTVLAYAGDGFANRHEEGMVLVLRA
jgi:hypothetical protein